MRTIKAILLVFIPVMALLFVQAEKNRLHKMNEHSFQVYNDAGVDVASDDDSISFPIDDDDLDDSPESAVRHFSAILICFTPEISNPGYEFSSQRPADCIASPRKISPSFLKVFRI